MISEYIIDLHIHSKYSLACSKDATIEAYSIKAKQKGIHVLGACDYTHPDQLKDIKQKLKLQDNGLYSYNDIYFMLATEISCIYKKNNKTYKNHLLIIMPTISDVEKLNKYLSKHGKTASNGRPIVKLEPKEILQTILGINNKSILIPAHIWTPWYSMLGSRSGYDSLIECFGDYSHHIKAIETGLSSDPLMNRRIGFLDKINIVSFSDAHSPDKLGREATLIESSNGISYDSIYNAINTGKGLKGTLEFFPQKGKYYFDGHRKCNTRLTPKQSLSNNDLCPSCKKPATLGVFNRVEKLSNDFVSKKNTYFEYVIPLKELLSKASGKGENTKTVVSLYNEAISELGTEFEILRFTKISKIKEFNSTLAKYISNLRSGSVRIEEGYDGEYGKIEF